MRTRPVLHEAEAKTHEAEATKFGLGLEDLTSLHMLERNNDWLYITHT